MGLHKSHFSLSVLSAGAFQMAQLSVGLEGMMSSFAARRLSAAPAPAANSRVRPRVGSSLHVRAQGDAGTSGQSAPGGQMSPAKSAKPAVQSKRGGEQKSSAAGSPAPKGQQRRPKAPPGPGSGRQQQPKKQPPPSAQAQSANVLFGSDPPGHKSGYVAIVGKPNAGKSTLLNALVGQKLAIVTPKAQTTRHRIIGIMSGDMHQAIFMDTPGIMATSRNKLDAAMMKNVKTALSQGDVLLAIVDSAAALELERPEDGLEGLRSSAGGGPQLCVVLNKADLVDAEGREKLEAAFRALPGVDKVLFTSAKEGTNVQELSDWVVSRLPLGPTLYPKDQVSEHPERFFVAEIVREHIFEMYQKEVPYCTTVRVVKHSERPGFKDVIKLRISVERETQKGIIIGAGGAALKALMSASRKAIEEFLEREVFMECEVVVDEGWRENDALVGAFGIAEASTIF